MVWRVVDFCRLIVYLGMPVFAGAMDLHAREDAALYKAVAFVTGTEEPERSRGFRIGLEHSARILSGRIGN